MWQVLFLIINRRYVILFDWIGLITTKNNENSNFSELKLPKIGMNVRLILRHRFNPWVRKILWRRKWQPTPVFLPGKCHGQRSLEGLQSMGPQRSEHNLATKEQQWQRQQGFQYWKKSSCICICKSICIGVKKSCFHFYRCLVCTLKKTCKFYFLRFL